MNTTRERGFLYQEPIQQHWVKVRHQVFYSHFQIKQKNNVVFYSKYFHAHIHQSYYIQGSSFHYCYIYIDRSLDIQVFFLWGEGSVNCWNIYNASFQFQQLVKSMPEHSDYIWTETACYHSHGYFRVLFISEFMSSYTLCNFQSWYQFQL